VETFREENLEAYKELVEALNGKSADVALLGHGKFHISIETGNLRIRPGVTRGAKSTGTCIVAPETLNAILDGRLTPLEAFFEGDLIARADLADLYRAYRYFVRFSDAALRSAKLKELLTRFQKVTAET
jgi:hypothetical protein